MSSLVALIYVFTALHSTDAFCERLYKNPYWSPQDPNQRAAAADIVVYGNIVESPCVKPIFVVPTNAPPANATNSSSSVQPTVPSSVDMKNATEGNTTDICFMRELYGVTMNVSCVIKGGYVPHLIHLRPFGFGPKKCTYFKYFPKRQSFYIETWQSFHVYKGLNYLVFLGRHKGNGDSNSFWPHEVNLQPAAIEVVGDAEKFLQPVFKATGGHAHSPTEVTEPPSFCKPYIAGVATLHVTFSFLMVVLACGLVLI